MDLDAPALEPPAGVTPNFDDPANRNGLGIFVIVFCSLFTTICMVLRMYGRVILMRRFQAEEVLAIAGYGCFWGCVWAMIEFQDAPGYFVHQWNVHLRELIRTQYLVLVFSSLFSVILPLLKAAILVEWCRIFIPSSKRKSPFFWISVVVIICQVLASIAIILALHTHCTPYKGLWYIAMESECWDIYSFQVAVAAVHMAGDIAILLLPQQRIWRLKMSAQRKLGISIVFGLGLVACVAAGARLVTTIINKTNMDNTYTISKLVLWAAVEMSCGFFVFCIPCLPNIFKEVKRSTWIRDKFSIKTTDAGSRSTELETYGGSNSAGKHGRTTSKSYSKLDEEAYYLGTSVDAESREHLQRHANPQKPNSLTVVCTTKISVVHENQDTTGIGTSSEVFTKSRDDLRSN